MGRRPAAEYAVSLARQRNAELVITYVNPSNVLPHADSDENDPSEQTIHTLLQRIPEDAAGIPVCRRLLRGNPADEILKLVDSEDVNLIVIGTHGETAQQKIPLGSIVTAILTRAKCRVIAVKGESVE